MSHYNRPRYRNLAGHKFGRLLVLELLPERSSSGGTRWLCVCECGARVNKRAQDLRSKHSLSCGCQLREKAAQSLQKVRTTDGHLGHGHARHGKQSRTYRSWKGAKNRCFNLHEPGWHDYGGRGIASELLRAFVDEQLDSNLVLVPSGGYSNCPGGASLNFFEIRKSQPIARRTWWKRRWISCLWQ